MLCSLKNVMRLPVLLALAFCWAGTLMTGMNKPSQVGILNQTSYQCTTGSVDHMNPKISEMKLLHYINFSVSCSKVKQDNLLFSSEVLRDPLRGRRPGVSRSEEVCVFFSFMGNTCLS